MNSSIIELLTPIVIAVVGAIWTILSYLVQHTYNKSQIYITFREKFKEFQVLLPAEINKRDKNGNFCYRPSKSEETEYNRLIEQYWWICFDEWFICCKQCHSCKSLWRKYYSIGVANALEREDWKQAFKRLVAHGESFLGLDREFAEEVDRIHRQRFKTSIFS